ncbi:hypothetical protein B5M09_010463, partial [Aphanomyces astaci]
QAKLLDYDAFLKQHGIEEKVSRGGRRTSTRAKTSKRSYSSDDIEDDEDDEDDEADSSSSDDDAKPVPKKGTRSSARKPPAKKQAAAVSSKSRTATQRSSKKTTTKQDHSNSNSSDTDDFVAEVSSSSKKATKKKKAASTTAAKSKKNKAGPAKAKKRNVQPKRALSSSHDDDSYNSSNDSAKATSFSRKKGKKPHDDSTDSDELFRKLPRGDDESDDGDECFIVDKVLAKETHTAAEWAKKCRGMHTHYVSLGSIFVDDDDDDDHRTTQDDTEPKDVAADDDDEDAPGIEKFLIKWRNLSYLHVTWETESALVEYEKNAKGKLQRFQDRTAKLLLLDEAQGDEYFNPEFCTVDRILNVQPSDVDDGKGGFQLEYYVKWKALPYDECTWEQEVDVHDDAAVQLYHAFNKEPPPPSSAASLKRTTAQFRPYNADNPIRFKTDLQQLRDYQVEGVNWMIFNWYNHRNSLLADEMGLGKTVQTVAYINHLVTKENLRGPYLIIAPLSTFNYARAGELLHSVIPQLEREVEHDDSVADEEPKHSKLLLGDAVTSDHIAMVVARATGIPVSNLLSGEKKRLLNMENLLETRVVGQLPAVKAVSDCIRLARAGLHAHNRPLGVFLFLGPTGTYYYMYFICDKVLLCMQAWARPN